jgi:hypothetical protein
MAMHSRAVHSRGVPNMDVCCLGECSICMYCVDVLRVDAHVKKSYFFLFYVKESFVADLTMAPD